MEMDAPHAPRLSSSRRRPRPRLLAALPLVALALLPAASAFVIVRPAALRGVQVGGRVMASVHAPAASPKAD